MARLINISDNRRRDAQVALVSAPKPPRAHYQGPAGVSVKAQRFVKATAKTSYQSLDQRWPDPEDLVTAMIEGNPEIDLELVGRQVTESDRVWLRPDGSVLYSARFLQVVESPEGEELSREAFIDVKSTVNDESPLPWSGRLLPIDMVLHRFALVRRVALRHVNGLTYDFLYDIAKVLHDAQKMLFVGSGPKGNAPLIFQTNGSPYRGFLEGRVHEQGFLLVLHLSNLELKDVLKKEESK